MKIGLIDVDGHHYPNLALMKLSAWHKARGDTVEWWRAWFNLSWKKIHEQGMEAIERRKLHEGKRVFKTSNEAETAMAKAKEAAHE